MSTKNALAEAWEDGARWAWDRSDYTEEELQQHLDEYNPFKRGSNG